LGIRDDAINHLRELHLHIKGAILMGRNLFYYIYFSPIFFCHLIFLCKLFISYIILYNFCIYLHSHLWVLPLTDGAGGSLLYKNTLYYI
jgi:hypothetical protein